MHGLNFKCDSTDFQVPLFLCTFKGSEFPEHAEHIPSESGPSKVFKAESPKSLVPSKNLCHNSFLAYTDQAFWQ